MKIISHVHLLETTSTRDRESSTISFGSSGTENQPKLNDINFHTWGEDLMECKETPCRLDALLVVMKV